MERDVQRYRIMFRKLAFWLVLLSPTTAMAAAQNFLLGLDYAEQTGTGPLFYVTSDTVATDAQGAIYILANDYITAQPSYLTKLTPAGDQVVYQTTLPFTASGMAIDPAGNAYLAGSNFVEKLGTDGATVLYRTVIGGSFLTPYGIAVDAAGRAYVTGTVLAGELKTTTGAFQQTPPGAGNSLEGFVVRLKPSGTVDYGTYLGGTQPAGIAVDTSGSAFVAGTTDSASFPSTPGAYLTSGYAFLARLAADGSGLIYSTFTEGDAPCCVAVDSADSAVVALQNGSGTGSVIMRFNPEGTAVAFSQALAWSFPAGLAVDGASNIYIALWGVSNNYPAKNSLAPCAAAGSSALTVLDGNGNVLQSTYLAGLSGYSPNLTAIALGGDATVHAVGPADPAYTPTQQLAGSSGGLLSLTSLSPNAKAQVVQLACVTNAASYASTYNMGIAGGEIVSLFGEGLGPAAGTQPQVTAQTGFPKQLANVQVTFNGTPGPLLYVQRGQINAIAPWSIQTGQTVDICVVNDGAPTNCIVRTVVDVNPGVFTTDGVYAAALNQDGTLNSASNPAKAGSIVTIFATGLGAISPAPSDGAIVGLPLPANVLPVTMFALSGLTFFGQIDFPVTVDSAGPAPWEVAGASQVKFTVIDVGYPLTLAAGQGSATFWLYVGP